MLSAMKLKQVQKWTEDKREIQALISAYLVVNAENHRGLMYHIGNNRELSEAMTIGGIDDWPRLYKDWLSECDAFFDMLTHVRTLDQQVYAASLPLLNNLRFAQDTQDIDLTLVRHFLRRTLLNNFEVPQSEPEGSINQLIEQCRFLFQFPHFVFALKVLIPCVLIYRTTPSVLLRWSLEGDIESLEKLLRLDSNLHNLPEVRQIWENECRYRQGYRYAALVKAMAEPVVTKISLRNIKIAIATFIEYVFKRTDHPISRREIRNLFDAYARDLDVSLIDLDLPEGEGAFGRAINRENKRWKETDVTLPPRKNTLSSSSKST